ncbi:hypothetical protein [Microcoleus sp. herbarium12]|jgi:hypothetical protein|uniref:hypothetical protein n=1 Tax=Microcoleus sp. herbarium12 TaxID=3055437 RepID=UPI002FD77A28
MMIQFLLPIYLATAPLPPPVYTWCTFEMIQTESKEMISAAYGMGNVPVGTDLTELCQAFYTRDIRAENKPLELVSSRGESTTFNPDAYWVANTWRRALTAAELEQYACLFNKNAGAGGLLTSATSAAINLMPQSPDSIRIPALMIAAINSTNSPILRYAAVVMYNTGIPIMSIAALVKAWKLTRR